MRADEPIKPNLCFNSSVIIGADYINQLRVDRLMAKAWYFWCKSYEIEMADQAGYAQHKLMKRMEQCRHIAEAYEARARRIKEGM